MASCDLGNWVGIATPNTVYIGIANRAEFDKLDLPARDTGPAPDGSHVITKSINDGKFWVIFQHWIATRPLPGLDRTPS